jgi:hypothetical protein
MQESPESNIASLQMVNSEVAGRWTVRRYLTLRYPIGMWMGRCRLKNKMMEGLPQRYDMFLSSCYSYRMVLKVMKFLLRLYQDK